MTKERRLAIKMWEGIRDGLADKPKDISNYDFIVTYKKFFCELYKLNWNSYCWFCQYIRRKHNCGCIGCIGCPLQSCFSSNASYFIALDIYEHHTVQERIDACNEIITALKEAGTRTNSDS